MPLPHHHAPHEAPHPHRSVDTSEEIAALQAERWQEMTPAEKLELVGELSETVRELALIGLHRQHPQASERECFLRLAARNLGVELARKAYPELADIEL